MWIVTAKTVSGADARYEIAAGKDTERAFVLALAFQEHGTKAGSDPLTTEAEVTWTSDNVKEVNEIGLSESYNYGVQRKVAKGEWVRHSVRAFRSADAAKEALESAASEFPDDQFRVTRASSLVDVIAVSKNASTDPIEHFPAKPIKEEPTPVKEEAAKAEPAKTDNKPKEAKTAKAA